MEKKPTTYRLSDETKRQLADASALTGRSKAQIIEFAVEDYYRSIVESIGVKRSAQVQPVQEQQNKRKRH